MRITATDYSQHILLELRRPREAPPLSTILTRYVSHMAQKLPRVNCKTPLIVTETTLQLNEAVAHAMLADAIAAMAKRGYQFGITDVVSIYHQQAGIEVTPETKSGIYIDSWALCPVRVDVNPNLVMKLSKSQWQNALGAMRVTDFCARFLSGLGEAGKCEHVAQLSNRLCVVLVPLTTFRTKQLVRCDVTHQAIHEADRTYRAITDTHGGLNIPM